MFGSIDGILAAAIALLPGGIFTWRFEAAVGRRRDGVGDRLLRIFIVSAIFVALFGWVAYYYGYPQWLRLLDDNLEPAWWAWLLPVAYVALPGLAGHAAGRLYRITRVARFFDRGHDTAWEKVFTTPWAGYIRLKLTDDTWVYGPWGAGSYAASHEPFDLFVSDTAFVRTDGQPVTDDDGRPKLRGFGVLIAWSAVQYAEICQIPEESGTVTEQDTTSNEMFEKGYPAAHVTAVELPPPPPLSLPTGEAQPSVASDQGPAGV